MTEETAEFSRKTVDILIMAHGLLYMNPAGNPILLEPESVSVVSIAPLSTTSWSNTDVEDRLKHSLNRRLTDPELAKESFEDIVIQSSQESGVFEVLKRNYSPSKMEKIFNVQKHEINEKLMTFYDENPENAKHYGIWYLDDPEGPMNLLRHPSLEFPKIEGKEDMFLSSIIATLRAFLPNSQINILDYSCNSCIYQNSEVIPHGDARLMRRLSRGLAYLINKRKPKPKPKNTKRRTATSRRVNTAIDIRSQSADGVSRKRKTTNTESQTATSRSLDSDVKLRSQSADGVSRKRKRYQSADGVSRNGGSRNAKSRKRRINDERDGISISAFSDARFFAV